MRSRISPQTAEAVAEFFQAEASGLFGYALTFPHIGRADAEDLIQVAFQAAAMEWGRQLCQLDQENKRKWLYRVLRNKAVDQWRSQLSMRLPSHPIEADPRSIQEPAHSALSSIAIQRCWEVIKKMPAARQRVAILKWFEEWSSAEIASQLGISQATVRAHLKLARDELLTSVGPQVTFIDFEDEKEGGNDDQ
ncbi:RNA polymerase sigma factor [Nonomuraea sp. NPDC002799]